MVPPAPPAPAMGISLFFSGFDSEMNKFFGITGRNSTTGSPTPKRNTSDKQAPFTTEQASWMQEGVGAAFNAFGAVIETKFSQFEQDMNAKLKAQSEANAEILKEVKELKAEVAQVQAASVARVESSTRTQANIASAPEAQSIPYELRTVARIGNLGFETPSIEIETRAKSILSEAGITPDMYLGLSDVRQKGSLAELAFHDPNNLQKARLAIHAMSKSFVDGKFVWLDVKKTSQELKPTRIMHRITEYLEEVEKANGRNAVITKFPGDRKIKVDDNKEGSSYGGEWHWTHFVRQRYSIEELNEGKAYAEDE